MFSHNEVRHILLNNASTFNDRNYILSLESVEADKIDNIMIGKLYRLALDKSNIDFANIPNSKGDITKFNGYSNMVDSLELVKTISKLNNTKVKEIEVVQTAINNIVVFRSIFTKAFLKDNDFCVLMYNLLVCSCIEATSVIISSYVDFIKSPSKVEFTIIKNSSSRGCTSIDCLNKFNLCVKSGDFNKVMVTLLGDKENFIGSTTTSILIPGVILGSAAMIVPLLRELTYYFFYSRMKTSEFLKHQAAVLELNRQSVKSSNLPAQKKKAVLRNQAEIAKNLTRYADKISVNSTSSQRLSEEQIYKENKSLTLQEVQSQSSSNDVGFLL